MKRYISLILVLIMIFTLVSCGGLEESVTTTEETQKTEEAQNKTAEKPKETDNIRVADGNFSVGFSRESINPDNGVGLGGFDNPDYRLSKKILDSVYFTSVAMRDGTGNLAFLCSVDTCNITGTFCDNVRKYAAKKYDIPESNIIISATHSHSAPSFNTDKNSAWINKALASAVKAVNQSANDLEKAEIYTGSATAKDMNYVRRYQKADGTWGTNVNGVKHESVPDQQIQVIKFDRLVKKDIVIANFQCHATFIGSETGGEVSADFIGPFRDELGKTENANIMFIQGASGNLVPGGKLAGERTYPSKFTDYIKYGKELASYASAAIKGAKKTDFGEIKSTSQDVSVKYDHTRDGEAKKAKEVYDLLRDGNMSAADAKAKEYGFASKYDGRDVYLKSTKPATGTIPVSAFKIGNISFIAAPYEMFDTNGMYIKDNSPFKMTFVCELANGSYSYIPSAIAFDHGGYEVNSCKYQKGVGETLADSFVKMLKEINK